MMRVRTRTSFCTNGDLARRAVELSVTRATQVHQGRRLRIPRRSIAAATLFLLRRCQSLEHHACDRVPGHFKHENRKMFPAQRAPDLSKACEATGGCGELVT